MSEETGRLRVATYLVPSIRVQFFEFVAQYLEEALKKPVTLIYESRGHGGFVEGHGDPFEQDECDIAFVSSTAYYQLESRKIKGADLLPISTVHRHAGSGQDESGQDVAGVYVDVITHADAAERIKEFMDLRGCNWVVTHEDSLTTSLLAQQKLKKLGETLSFFGSILKDLLSHTAFRGVSFESLRELVEADEKNRFTLVQADEDGGGQWKIKANQGNPWMEGDVESIEIKRREFSVLIYIDLRTAMQDGYEFLLSPNGVVLCPGDDGYLPAKYFKEIKYLTKH
ncbi:unnamed protein product [Cyprideis torosa]|uniref:Uncharacterized protein n=1 Tax=Cyprideis torosa TaxID=163714 RepID=A0A7R8ZWI7_9CRUS|nr:unnamed protein product [Cyprideis torosa]CAG0905013.1 unnamed protein product [Cyprideis torosa]